MGKEENQAEREREVQTDGETGTEEGGGTKWTC